MKPVAQTRVGKRARAKKCMIISFILAIAGVVVLFMMLQAAPFQRTVLEKLDLIQHDGDKGLPLTYDRLTGFFPFNFRIHDVEFTDPIGRVVKAETATIDFDLTALARGEVIIEEMVLTRPVSPSKALHPNLDPVIPSWPYLVLGVTLNKMSWNEIYVEDQKKKFNITATVIVQPKGGDISANITVIETEDLSSIEGPLPYPPPPSPGGVNPGDISIKGEGDPDAIKSSIEITMYGNSSEAIVYIDAAILGSWLPSSDSESRCAGDFIINSQGTWAAWEQLSFPSEKVSMEDGEINGYIKWVKRRCQGTKLSIPEEVTSGFELDKNMNKRFFDIRGESDLGTLRAEALYGLNGAFLEVRGQVSSPTERVIASVSPPSSSDQHREGDSLRDMFTVTFDLSSLTGGVVTMDSGPLPFLGRVKLSMNLDTGGGNGSVMILDDILMTLGDSIAIVGTATIDYGTKMINGTFSYNGSDTNAIDIKLFSNTQSEQCLTLNINIIDSLLFGLNFVDLTTEVQVCNLFSSRAYGSITHSMEFALPVQVYGISYVSHFTAIASRGKWDSHWLTTVNVEEVPDSPGLSPIEIFVSSRLTMQGLDSFRVNIISGIIKLDGEIISIAPESFFDYSRPLGAISAELEANLTGGAVAFVSVLSNGKLSQKLTGEVTSLVMLLNAVMQYSSDHKNALEEAISHMEEYEASFEVCADVLNLFENPTITYAGATITEGTVNLPDYSTRIEAFSASILMSNTQTFSWVVEDLRCWVNNDTIISGNVHIKPELMYGCQNMLSITTDLTVRHLRNPHEDGISPFLDKIEHSKLKTETTLNIFPQTCIITPAPSN